MAKTTVVKVQVQELTRFGFKHEGRFVNYSKQLSETDKVKVVPGAEFEAEFYVADSGKEYLNKINNMASTPKAQTAEEKPNADTERAKKFTPKYQKKEEVASTTMSKSEWQAKDRSQLIGGLCHDAAQLTLAAVTVGLTTEQVLKQYMEILTGVIKLREEVK